MKNNIKFIIMYKPASPPPSLSLVALAQSESNRSYPPTIHSFTPRPEIYERVVATPLIIALAYTHNRARLFQKKVRASPRRYIDLWASLISLLELARPFSMHRGKIPQITHPCNYRTSLVRVFHQPRVFAFLRMFESISARNRERSS